MSIDTATLKQAKQLAAEVAQLCTKVEADFERVRKARFAVERTGAIYYGGPDTRLTAALRRRSMDLTRALAELRRR